VIYESNLFIGNGQAPLSEHVLPAGRFQNNFFTKPPNLPEKLKSQTSILPEQLKSFQEQYPISDEGEE
jgi:hypothetical protein